MGVETMKTGAVVLLGLVVAVLVAQGSADATTYRVPQDVEDVRSALRQASYGDTVLVSPGRYRLQAKIRSGVVLTSTDGPDSTVLFNKRWHILRLDDCDMLTKISGFTFEGKGCNVAFACTTGAPIIEGNVIKQSWDGIILYKCNALIKDNIIQGCNRGIYMDYSDPEVVDNVVRNNGDGISMISSAPVIARCELERNGRAVLIHGHSYPTIGGSLETANSFIANGYSIYNAGLRIEGTQYTDEKEVAVATYNYWGGLCPEDGKMRGEVVYRPWTDAERSTTYEKCPEGQPAEEQPVEERPAREKRTR
jgi:parallel beta-helix repeat protein